MSACYASNVSAPSRVVAAVAALIAACGGRTPVLIGSDEAPDAGSIADAGAPDVYVSGVDATTPVDSSAPVTDGGADAAMEAASPCGPCAGTCVGDRCLVVLATNRGVISDIAIDDANVYFSEESNASAIVRVPLGGGAPVTLQPSASASSLAVSASALYWTDEQSVLGMPLAGGATITLAASREFPGALGFGGAGLVWIETEWGTVTTATLDGGAISTLANANLLGGAPNAAPSADVVVWDMGEETPLLATPLDGGASTLLGTIGAAGAVATDGTNAFYTTGATVARWPLAGGPEVVVASAQKAWGVAADGAHVYYTDMVAQTVQRIGYDAAAPETLVSGMPGLLCPARMRVDATSLYWATNVPGDAGGVSGMVYRLTPK